MKPDVLLTRPATPAVLSALERSFRVHRLWETQDQAAFLEVVGPSIWGIATDGSAGASAALMAALPNLEIIAANAVGLDAVDLAHAKSRGIVVTNTPDVLTEDVADMALALLLAAAREIVPGHDHVRSGAWERDGNRPLARRVNGKRAGIVGLGRIGRAVARRLEAMNVRVAYHNRRPIESPYIYHGDAASLARDVDFLIVTAAGGDGSRGLVDREVIEALGPDGILVNVARGRSSTRRHSPKPSATAGSARRDSTCSPTSPACRSRSGRSRTSCSSRTWGARPSRPGRPWANWSSATWRPTSPASSCRPQCGSDRPSATCDPSDGRPGIGFDRGNKVSRLRAVSSWCSYAWCVFVFGFGRRFRRVFRRAPSLSPAVVEPEPFGAQEFGPGWSRYVRVKRHEVPPGFRLRPSPSTPGLSHLPR